MFGALDQVLSTPWNLNRQTLFRRTISTMNIIRKAAAAAVSLGILGCSGASVAAPVMARAMRRANEADLRRLKELLEG